MRMSYGVSLVSLHADLYSAHYINSSRRPEECGQHPHLASIPKQSGTKSNLVAKILATNFADGLA